MRHKRVRVPSVLIRLLASNPEKKMRYGTTHFGSANTSSFRTIEQAPAPVGLRRLRARVLNQFVRVYASW